MLVMPAIFKFKPLPSHCREWGWCHMEELAAILQDTPQNVLLRYLHLSDDGFSIAITEGAAMYYSVIFQPDAPFVPAGWVKDVLNAERLGIHRVTLVRHQHSTAFFVCPEGTISGKECIFNGGAYQARVGITSEGQPYWTYAACPHTYGSRSVANIVNGRAIRQYRCVRCGAVVGGGK